MCIDSHYKLIDTSNDDMKKYIGKIGYLQKRGNNKKFYIYFDMLQYWLATSLVKEINIEEDLMVVQTLNSVYTFKKTDLSLLS
jgi:nitrogenase molybdenum-iron protein alpha/beta subunit